MLMYTYNIFHLNEAKYQKKKRTIGKKNEESRTNGKEEKKRRAERKATLI